MSAVMIACVRSPTPPNPLVTTLKMLKLFGMAQAVDELATQGSPAYLNAEGVLEQLLKAEVAEREVRSVNYQMKIARFPVYRDLSGFDFAQSVVNEALIRQLYRGRSWTMRITWSLSAGQALGRPIWPPH